MRRNNPACSCGVSALARCLLDCSHVWTCVSDRRCSTREGVHVARGASQSSCLNAANARAAAEVHRVTHLVGDVEHSASRFHAGIFLGRLVLALRSGRLSVRRPNLIERVRWRRSGRGCTRTYPRASFRTRTWLHLTQLSTSEIETRMFFRSRESTSD